MKRANSHSLVGSFFFLCFRFQQNILAILFHNFRFFFWSFFRFFARFSLYYSFFLLLLVVCGFFCYSVTYMISLDWIHPGWTVFCSCWPSPWSDLWFSCWKLKWYWPYYWTKSMWLTPCPLSQKHTHLISCDCYVAQWWMCVFVSVKVVMVAYILLFFLFVTCLLLLSLLLLLLLLPFSSFNWFTSVSMSVKSVCMYVRARYRGREEESELWCGQSTAAKKNYTVHNFWHFCGFDSSLSVEVYQFVCMCVCVCKISRSVYPNEDGKTLLRTGKLRRREKKRWIEINRVVTPFTALISVLCSNCFHFSAVISFCFPDSIRAKCWEEQIKNILY